MDTMIKRVTKDTAPKYLHAHLSLIKCMEPSSIQLPVFLFFWFITPGMKPLLVNSKSGKTATVPDKFDSNMVTIIISQAKTAIGICFLPQKSSSHSMSNPCNREKPEHSQAKWLSSCFQMPEGSNANHRPLWHETRVLFPVYEANRSVFLGYPRNPTCTFPTRTQNRWNKLRDQLKELESWCLEHWKLIRLLP